MQRIMFILIWLICYVNNGWSQIEVKNTLPNTFIREVPLNVNVTITKNDFVSHFAKYILEVPIGFKVTAVDSKEGAFTFEKQTAKVVWVKIPDDSCFTITLQIEALQAARETGRFLEKFIFLEDKQRDETRIKIKTIVVVNYSEEAMRNNQVVIQTPTATPVSEKTFSINSQNKDNENITQSVTKNNEGATTYFCLQLGAFKIKPSLSAYSTLSNVSIKYLNGLYKVIYGSFKKEEEATKQQAVLQKKGIDSFVIKLNQNQ